MTLLERKEFFNHLLANMVRLPQVLLRGGLRHACKKQGLTLVNLKHILPGQRLVTKAAMYGLTVDEIMKAADWSREGVFQKFYYRPQHSVEFGSAVLAASASKSHVDMENEPYKV